MPSTYSIRVATLQDLDAISELLQESYSALMRNAYQADALKALLPIITQAKPELLSSGKYYLAENKTSQAVGCGGWSLERPGDGEVIPELAHIRHFGTHPEWIRQGIGKQLFSQCQEKAKVQAVNCFECYSSLNGESFYHSLGFERVRLVEIPIGPHHSLPSVLMTYSF